MIKLLQTLSRVLSGYASLFVIAAALVTFFYPSIFQWVSGNAQTVILGAIMLTMGLTLSTQDFKIVLSRPWDIFIGACAQFIIMP
ncbi:MAG: bile acid:sodium symporter family protein, partial [Paludibacteraceae bacterium]|nr:bile acid:sodium symporter family protein [Paludibacteraceae bacterium]